MTATDLPRYNFPAGTIIEIDGRPYKPLGETIPLRMHLMDCETGQPFVCPDHDGVVGLPTHDAFDDLVLAKRVEITLPAMTVAARVAAAKTEWDRTDAEEIDPKVHKMLRQCEVLDENGVQNGVKAIAIGLIDFWTAELKAEFGEADNPHTIKRWRSERGRPGARKPQDMIRMNGRVPRAPYLSDVVHDVKQKHALRVVAGHCTVKNGHAAASTELQEINQGLSKNYPQPEKPHVCFSYDTFRRACIALEGIDASLARHGKSWVEGTMRGGGAPLTAGRILEKVIVDHTPLPAFLVIDPEREMVAGRPNLTLMVDVHSRAVVSWVITFHSPSYWTVCETLLRAVLPKRPPRQEAERYPVLKRICGKPSEVIVDNAVEFRGHGLEDAAKSGAFSVRFCPIKKPRYRAIGERAIGTIQRKIVEELPGRAFPIEYSRRADYNPEKLACVTMGELEAIANKAIAEYHTEDHDGLDGRQPALVWQKSANKHGIDVPHDWRRFRLETLQVEQNVQVTKSGVRMHGLRYHCIRGVEQLIDNNLRLEPRRQSHVDATIHTKVKFNPEDISVIFAWDRTEKKYVELKCDDQTYATGMPLWFHEEIRDTAQKEKQEFNTEAERLAARTRRIEFIKSIAPEARHRERKRVARLYEVPRLRQITGNLVSLEFELAQAVTADQFIAQDLASQTNLDAEILAPRPESRRKMGDRRDRRDAGQEQTQVAPAPRKSARRQSVGGAK